MCMVSGFHAELHYSLIQSTSVEEADEIYSTKLALSVGRSTFLILPLLYSSNTILQRLSNPRWRLSCPSKIATLHVSASVIHYDRHFILLCSPVP